MVYRQFDIVGISGSHHGNVILLGANGDLIVCHVLDPPLFDDYMAIFGKVEVA